MPQTRADKVREWSVNFLRAVRIGMAKEDIRSITALAQKAGLPRSTLGLRLKNPATLTLGELKKIRQVIPIDLEIILKD